MRPAGDDLFDPAVRGIIFILGDQRRPARPSRRRGPRPAGSRHHRHNAPGSSRRPPAGREIMLPAASYSGVIQPPVIDSISLASFTSRVCDVPSSSNSEKLPRPRDQAPQTLLSPAPND